MTTFDGSTGGGAHAAPGYLGSGGYDNDFPPPAAPPIPEPAYDAFEALREQLAERDDASERTTTVDIPGLGWRLVCAIDFTYGQYKEWQKAALPRNQRNGRKVNVLDMDQAALSYFVLLNTCEGIEYQRSNGEWDPLTEAGGQPATLQSGMLMTKMNVMDPRLLVKKLFGNDARLIRAGNEVIAAAGYIEDDESAAEDPTP